MKKVLYVATVVKTHIMEFHIPFLKMMKEMGWETAVAARNDYDNPKDCVIPYCDKYYDIPFERNPFKIGNLKAYSQLKELIDNEDYDIIHCHTPVGGVLTRLAAGKARRNGSKLFYTAHGFHFYKGASIINWMFYYPVERYLAHKTDVLITINTEDYNRAKKFKAGEVVYVPGVGIDINKFNAEKVNRGIKRTELGLKDKDFVLLSVGELIARKNHEIVLDALRIINDRDTNNNIIYLICGQGILETKLKEKSLSLGISESVHFLGYRNDINEICSAADLFVFMSHQEGLPVALMEAMACGVPAVCSNIRGNTDLINTNIDGELVSSTAEDVADAIERIKGDELLRNKYAVNAKKKIRNFDISIITDIIQKLYIENSSSIKED